MSKPFQATFTLLLFSLLLLGGCSRQELFDNAMAWERDSAGLSPHTITVDDMDIAYLSNTETSDGDVLVMIHGFAANKDNWVRMAGELTNSYQVYAIDLPGHGDSSKDLDRSYHLEAQVQYLNHILDALELGQVHLIGNSMGGAITALYAATYPERVRTATLFDPAGVFQYDSELVDLIKDGSNPLIVSKPGDMERLVDFVMVKKPFVPWPIYDVLEEQALENQAVNERIFDDIRDSGYQEPFRKALESISAPVLVVWGKQDRVINYRNAEVFEERIPDARTVLLDGFGHVPMIEDPAQSADLVRQFTAAHLRGPQSQQ